MAVTVALGVIPIARWGIAWRRLARHQLQARELEARGLPTQLAGKTPRLLVVDVDGPRPPRTASGAERAL
ncbi:MAG TPA: hypothetical protein VGD10_08275 [Allosphingosinicella sp.]|uniref:hypothetical protein n=1 Tax=Allosphingosinicella sp. TaxID=2823234 RepID=UPI002EDADE9A